MSHTLAVLFAMTLTASPVLSDAARPLRPVATYSIVARDPATGELGAAVQSHWFSVGTAVPWVEAGVGAVATQSFTERSYGPLGLAAMRAGTPPREALLKLVAEDPHPEVRQVAFVDATGRVAAHTGSGCIPAAGHRTGDGYSVQANLMLGDEVPEAMAAAFERSSGPLAERMLAALEAAQAVGGDVRGKQSAALVVARARPSAAPWTDRVIDLRVDDDPEPLRELGRLLILHRAYEHMNRGDEAMAAGRMDDALAEYARARERVPDNDEFVFWTAVTLVGNGRLESSLPLFAKAFRMSPGWILLVPRLADVGQLPSDEAVLARILEQAPRAGGPSKRGR